MNSTGALGPKRSEPMSIQKYESQSSLEKLHGAVSHKYKPSSELCGKPMMPGPSTSSTNELLNYLTDRNRVRTASPHSHAHDKGGTWSTFMAKAPSGWSPPEYYPTSGRSTSSRPASATANVFTLDAAVAKINAKIAELAVKPLSVTGLVSKHGEKPKQKSEYPEVVIKQSSKPKKVHHKQKAKAKTSKSKISSSGQVEKVETGGATPADERNSKGEGDGNGIPETLSSFTEEMLKVVVSNAVDNLPIQPVKVFPVVPQNSMSNIELNYRLAKKGLPVSERYAKHGVDLVGQKKAELKGNEKEPGAAMQLQGRMSKILATNHSHIPPKLSLFSQLPFLSPIRSRPSSRPRQTQTKLPSTSTSTALGILRKSASAITRPLPLIQLPKLKPKPTEESDKAKDKKIVTQLSRDIKTAVAAISGMPKQDKIYVKSATSPNLTVGVVGADTRNKLSKNLISASTKGRKNSASGVNLKEATNQFKSSTPPSLVSKKSRSKSEKRPEPLPPLFENFLRTQHKLIDEQWKHVLKRQVGLEAEVIQLLQSLQEKIVESNTSLEIEKPCYCDTDTKDKLEAIVKKQKEVILLQMDLNQRYGLNHFAAMAGFVVGKTQPVVNAFEAHYSQLSPFAREMNEKMVYYCPPCNFSAKDELAFRAHLESSGHVVRTYQGITKHQPAFSCEHCQQVFSGTTKYMNHMVSSDGKGGTGPKCKQEDYEHPKRKNTFPKY